MRPSSRQTCSQLATPRSATRSPIAPAPGPEGAAYKVTVRGLSTIKRARLASVVIALLDDLVGASEDRLRHGKAERLGSLEVDDQLENRRLLHRQIGRFGTGQDPT